MVAPVRGSAAGVPMTNLTPADLAALTATRESACLSSDAPAQLPPVVSRRDFWSTP